MKARNFFMFAMVMAAVVTAFTACEKGGDDPFGPNPNPNPNPTSDTLTVAQAIAKQDGKEANLKTGTWTRLEPNLTANKLNWAFITQQYDLTAFAGKSIYIAFKYISTTTTAGTWEVKNVKVDTEAIDVIGDNDKGGVNNPYTVAEVIALAPADKTNPLKEMVYVTGTIVGVWDNTGSESVAAFTAPFNTADNVLLGTQEGYICVQLAKTEPRKTVNLKDTPANVGKTLTVRGDVILYNNMPGVKEISKYDMQ